MDTETDTSGLIPDQEPSAPKKRWLIWGLGLFTGLLLFAAAFCLFANLWVVSSARPYVIHEISQLPKHQVGLVLGTSTYTQSGTTNRLFNTRMWAAVNLYNLGKVRHLIVSGANPDETYNEPRKMYQALVKSGVPEEAITMDFAGFRTLDSVIRAHKVFGQGAYTVISQEFHDYRAVFLAREHGLDVVAYAVPEEEPGQSFRTEFREFTARVRAVLDVYLLRAKPRYLGEPVVLPLEDADD